MALIDNATSERLHGAVAGPVELRFDVQGVPHTVVNRAGAFVGALREKRFVGSVLQLAGVGDEAIAQPWR